MSFPLVALLHLRLLTFLRTEHPSVTIGLKHTVSFRTSGRKDPGPEEEGKVGVQPSLPSLPRKKPRINRVPRRHQVQRL